MKIIYIRLEYQSIVLAGRVFASGPRDQDSIVGRVIPKTQKWYLMLSYLALSIVR